MEAIRFRKRLLEPGPSDHINSPVFLLNGKPEVVESKGVKNLGLLEEDRFIVDCLRTEVSGGSIDNLRKYELSAINWDWVYEKALKWNILPLLYRTIRNRSDLLRSSDIPDHVIRDIETAYIKTYVVNKANFEQLSELIKSFSGAGIRVILLKGSHLAQFVYQDIGLRWMADIDVLIRKEDLKKTEQLLFQMEYDYLKLEEVVWDDFGIDHPIQGQANLIEWYKANHMHLNLGSQKAIKNLEVHWGIARTASPFTIDIEGLWERAWAKEVNGVKPWVLSPEDLLLHLSLHDSYYHHLELFGLRPCCDIAATINQYRGHIDWRQLGIRSREWGIEKYLYLMLRLTQEIFEAGIPDSFLDSIKPSSFNDGLVIEAKKRIFHKKTERPAFKGMRYAAEIHKFNPNDNLFQKVAFFLRRLPISTEELASRYSLPASSKRIYFYRVVRFISLLLSYARVYVPFFLYRLRHGQNERSNYNLDLWLTSPTSKK